MTDKEKDRISSEQIGEIIRINAWAVDYPDKYQSLKMLNLNLEDAIRFLNELREDIIELRNKEFKKSAELYNMRGGKEW